MKKYVKNLFNRLVLCFHPKKFAPKVFCVGYNKTGTTSLGKSLEMLGYRNSSFSSYVWRQLYKKNRIDKIIEYTAKFDSFDDLPWLKEDMIPVLDDNFPNSKFVYLERDEISWKKSYLNWTFKVTGEKPDVEKGWENYIKHRDFVFEFFKSRPSDLLIINIKDPMGFEKLAVFLSKAAPTKHFPHFNNT